VPLRRPYDVMRAGRPSNWAIGIGAGLLALAGVIVGSAYGNVKAKSVDPRLIAWLSAATVLCAGVVAVSRLANCLSHLAARRSQPSAGSGVRILSSVVGYVLVAFAVFDVLSVGTELLVGAGVAGVVLGIAAQQSLGNVFAGLVLILARPFTPGDHIRIRSGALGGIFEAWVVEMSLTYVTLRTDDGLLKIPNSAMLAAGVGQLPLVSTQQPATGATTGTATTGTAPGATPPAGAPGAAADQGEGRAKVP
jgi:small conductance mechanosensitive channel